MNTQSRLPLNSDEARLLLSWLPSATDEEVIQLHQALTAPASDPTSPTDILRPHPRQAEFLALDDDEALFGGSAGGGKSEALLMWLGEGIGIPDYSGIIFRRTYAQLSKSNDSLIAKSYRLYKPLGGHWNGTRHQWRFPSGAMIDLGQLQHESTVYDHQGPSYHRVAWDELTQFTEFQYTYLRGRVRKTKGFPIRLGMRATSNPGGVGHQWVKRRFITADAIRALKGMRARDPSPAGQVFRAVVRTVEGSQRVAFMPARIADNPALDMESYLPNLAGLPLVTRERLMNGDWSIAEGGIVQPEWLRYWRPSGEYYKLMRPTVDGEPTMMQLIHPDECLRFVIADCAGTSEDIARTKKGKEPSWTVIGTADFHRKDGWLILRDQRRGLWNVPTLIQNMREVDREQQPEWIGAENEKFGLAVIQLLADLPIKGISHEGKDKRTRFTSAEVLLESGKVFIPEFATWRDDWENELTAWTGDKEEQFDQGDVLGYMARYARRNMVGTAVVPSVGAFVMGRG